MSSHSVLRLVRAVAVLDGLDVVPSSTGMTVGTARDRGNSGNSGNGGGRGDAAGPPIPWPDVEGVLGHDDPLDPAPRLRLRGLARLHRWLTAPGADAAARLARAACPLALPVGHPLVPEPGWVREEVPGGVLVLGLGVRGPVPDDVVPVPPAVAARYGFGVPAWDRVRELAEEAGATAAEAWPDAGTAPLPRPPRDGADALTLLALPAVRERLAGPVAVPARDRLRLGAAAMDAAYLRAVWTLTPPARRGVPGPMTAAPDGLRAVPAVRPAVPRPPGPAITP